MTQPQKFRKDTFVKDKKIENYNDNTNSTTYVTMLYDLEKHENNGRKKLEEYYKYGEELCKLKVNIIFFVESHDIKLKIIDMRYKYDLLKKTRIIVRPITELKYYDCLNKISELDSKNKIKNMKDNKDTPLYRILRWNKFECLKQAINENVFSTNYVGWIDFNIFAHLNAKDSIKVIGSHYDKIRIGSIGRFYFFGTDRKDYYNYKKTTVVADFFSGNKTNMKEFIKYFEEELTYVLNTIAPLEDAIMTKIIYDKKTIFNPFLSDRHNMFSQW